MRPQIKILCITILLTNFLSFDACCQPIGYASVGLDTSIPFGELGEKMTKKVLWGLEIDGFLAPFKNSPSVETGLQIAMVFPSERKDEWNGLELKTSSTLVCFNLAGRFRPSKGNFVEPVFDVGGGLSYSSTTSSYEIVDRATFLEKFLLNEQDYVETHNVKEFGQSSWNIGFGAGVIINKTFVAQVRYNYSPEVVFINKEDVTIVDNQVSYKTSTSALEMITITIGLSVERALGQMSAANPGN